MSGQANSRLQVKAPLPVTPAYGGLLQRKCACGNHAMGGECEKCKKKRMPLQRKPSGSREISEVPPIVHEVLRSPGQPLNAETRAFFEPRFAQDFSAVRIHTDGKAAESASAVDALAYSINRNIVFANGHYAPESPTGRALLAHELAHVVQSGPHTSGHEITMGKDNDAAERDADHMTARILSQGVAETGNTRTGSPLVLRRKGKKGKTRTGKSACSLTVCWVPIGAGGLGKAGFVHGVINLTDSKGSQKHVEVDPAHHMTDIGLHSHVEIRSGFKNVGTCHVVPTTCPETDRLVPSANSYEARFVEYDPVVGPNSNSFVEWTLTNAGVSSSNASPPVGAQGWDFYNRNPSLRSKPPTQVLQAPAGKCKKKYHKAHSFSELVGLLREAEKNLNANGVTSLPAQIKTLRGLYYGTTWSEDYNKEKSLTRNLGFQAFTQTTSGPKNPYGIFHCGLFKALKESQDVVDSKSKRHFDFGHAIIALDARSGPAPSVPFPGFGGTGTEAVTWLGDLGGGAGMLAVARAASPSTNVLTRFRGTDYGGSINLEGDVAGFVIGRGGATKVAPPAVPHGKGLADIFHDYLSSTATGSEWKSRAGTFLQMHGGTLGTSGALTNRSSLIGNFSDKIESFACQYLMTRSQDGKISASSVSAAGDHVKPCSEETAETFVNVLDECSRTGGKIEAQPKHAPSPKPAATGKCSFMLKIWSRIGNKAKSLANDAMEKGSELLKEGEQKADEVKHGYEDWRKRHKLPWE